VTVSTHMPFQRCGGAAATKRWQLAGGKRAPLCAAQHGRRRFADRLLALEVPGEFLAAGDRDPCRDSAKNARSSLTQTGADPDHTRTPGYPSGHASYSGAAA